MRFSIIALFAAVLTVGASGVAAQDKDLAGDYAMKGSSLRPNSPSYQGDCKLAREGKVYKVNCVNSGSGDKYVGKGIVRGNVFSLYLGEYLVVYNIESDGKLVGNWAHSRSDDYGQETLTPK